MKQLFTFALSLMVFATAYAQKQVSAKEIFEAIDKKQNIQYDGVIVNGELDFTELSNRKVRTENRYWEEIKAMVEVPVVFRNCVFKNDVIAYKHLQNGKRVRMLNVDMGESGSTWSADFRENVVFENCTFEDGSEFKYSTFSKTANFSGTKFNESANFKYANFQQEVSFAKCQFDDYASFKYADFRENADFTTARFHDYADFKYSEFNDKVTFANCRFQRHADFKYADFDKGVVFGKTDFESSIDFKYSNGKRYVSR
jgi:uncharacterized protein YjbI with pentapeptide repeats